MAANILRKNTFLSNEFILFALSFIVLLFCSQCSPLYLFNDWGDPHIYFSIGKGMFNGKVVYKDLFDHKGPLIFLIYGLGYLISHTTFLGVYVFESLFLFVNLLFAYKIAKLFLDKDKAVFVALLYLFYFLCRIEQGGSADEFMTPLLMISLYYILRYCQDKDGNSKDLNRQFIIHGVMFALIFFIKLSICVFWAPLLLIPACQLLKEKNIKGIFMISLAFAGGFLLVAVPVVAYFIFNSALNDFRFAYFEFNSLYASTSMGLHFDAFANIAVRFVQKLINMDFYVYMLLFSMATMFFSKRYIKNIFDKGCIILSFALTYIMLTSAPYDLAYYYITLSVFSVFGFITIVGFAKDKFVTNRAVKPVFIVLVLLACILSGDRPDYLMRKKGNSYWQKEFAAIVNTVPNATVINLEHETGVATLAGTVPTFKYFFHPNIRNEAFPELREYHIDLIAKGIPTFVITNDADFPHISDNYHIVARHRPYENVEYYIYLFKRNGQ